MASSSGRGKQSWPLPSIKAQTRGSGWGFPTHRLHSWDHIKYFMTLRRAFWIIYATSKIHTKPPFLWNLQPSSEFVWDTQNLTDQEWNIDDQGLILIATTIDPAPYNLLWLIFCICKKGFCENTATEIHPSVHLENYNEDSSVDRFSELIYDVFPAAYGDIGDF